MRLQIRWTLPVLAILISGCSRSSDEPPSSSSQPNLQGDWVVVGDTSGRGDTGHMTLKADGTFTSDYTMAPASGSKTKGSTDTDSGKYIAGEEVIAGHRLTKVELTILTHNGKPEPRGATLKLFYDPKGNMLHDFLSVAYARPGDKQSAIDRLNRDK